MGNVYGEARIAASKPDEVSQFYRAALARLIGTRIPFMVGGGFAQRHYTRSDRPVKDLDLFVLPADARRVLDVLADVGTRAELLFPHWLGKVYAEGAFIDVIFSSGNGLAAVDDLWLRYASPGAVLGLPVRFCPAEESIWVKAFVAERERYDGADIAHLIRARGPALDWSRLLRRFGEHWRVLLAHLVLYGYIYPGHRHQIPDWVMTALLRKLSEEVERTNDTHTNLCRGTLLSREQYLDDIGVRGYRDARVQPDGAMSPADVELWTRAIAEENRENRGRG
jgi:hypothetical protein